MHKANRSPTRDIKSEKFKFIKIQMETFMDLCGADSRIERGSQEIITETRAMGDKERWRMESINFHLINNSRLSPLCTTIANSGTKSHRTWHWVSAGVTSGGVLAAGNRFARGPTIVAAERGDRGLVGLNLARTDEICYNLRSSWRLRMQAADCMRLTRITL